MVDCLEGFEAVLEVGHFVASLFVHHARSMHDR